MPKRIIYFLLFLFFWILAFLAYYHAHGAQFIYDHNMWMIEYERLGRSGLKTQFGEKAVHYIFQYTYFFLYKLFKWNGWYWTLLQTAWHAVNALLIFSLIAKWANWYKLNRPTKIAFVAALFFILSPYHTEAVIWGAGLEYMMVTTFVLSALLCLSEFLERGAQLFFALTYVFYLLALLTWELALVFPIMALTLFILSPFDKIAVRRFVCSVFLPSLGIISVYFLFGKWMGGSAISHYGAAVHLNVDPKLLIPNLTRFILKLFDVSLVWEKAHSYDFVMSLSKPLMLAGQIGIYSIVLGFCLRAILLRRDQFIVMCAGMCFIALLPVLNLYFAYFTYIESDRYVYLCSGFFYGGLAVLLFSFHGFLRFIIISAFLIIQVFFLHRFVTAWQTSGQVVNGLVQGFKWQEAPHIYVLATPDAVQGAWCLRSLPPYGIAIALHAQRGIDISKKMDEIMQYEMYGMSDSCHAEKTGDGVYYYRFGQCENWFIKDGMGTHGWEDSTCKVEIDQWGTSYTVKIKNYRAGDAVIYQVRDHWEEVK